MEKAITKAAEKAVSTERQPQSLRDYVKVMEGSLRGVAQSDDARTVYAHRAFGVEQHA